MTVNGMITGKSVYSRIKGKVAEWEEKHTALSRQLYGVEDSIEQKTGKRETAIVQLAQVYLPELTAKAVADTLPQLRKEAQEVFQLRQRERQSLEDRMAAIHQRRQALETMLDTVTGVLEQKVGERKTLEEKVANDLEGNGGYTALRRQAQDINAQLQTAEARYKDAVKEKVEKTPGYTANKLFTYLVRRKFGTQEYHGNFLTHWLDGWVARRVNYFHNKKNYDELLQRPAAVQKLIGSYKAQLEGVIADMQAREREASDKHGLTPVEEECRKLIDQRKVLVDGIGTADVDYKRTEAERRVLDNTKGAHYEQAIGAFKRYFKGQTIAQLRELAKTTKTQEDDRLVVAMEGFEGGINDLRKNAKELKAEQAEIAHQLQNLRQVENEFRRHDYEAARSRFGSSMDIDTLLLYLILGKYTVNDVSRDMAKSHRWEPAPTYSSSSSWSSPSHSSGGGFGGGGFSSGGGFGGGGFSGGGGFGR